MNDAPRNYNPLFAAVIALLVLHLALSAYQTFAPRQPLTRYEYKVETIPDSAFQQSMNLLGFEGWEAVSARRANDGNQQNPTFSYEIIFRRPVGQALSSIAVK